MRRIVSYFLVMLLFASCSTTKGNGADSRTNTKDLHPDQVFTITDDDIARETRKINAAFKGEWKYNGPSVDVSGKDLISGIGKPIAKSKLKKKLKNAYKKIGLDKARPQFVFNEDGSCSIKLLGASLNGTYNYNPAEEQITFKWHGVPLTAHVKQSGKKKVHITFKADKLLRLFSLASKVSDNSALKALSFLMDHYDDVMVGFELKK